MGETRENYQTYRLTRVELLSAIYLYLSATRGVKIEPSMGQLSQDPYLADTFLLETWGEPRAASVEDKT